MVLAAALGVGALGKRRFAAEAATWPAARAKIENVFIDVQNQGRYRTPVTHAVLGYGYSVGDLYYSGEIRLRAGETSLEPLDKEMVGQQVSIQFSPQEPGASIFLNTGCVARGRQRSTPLGLVLARPSDVVPGCRVLHPFAFVSKPSLPSRALASVSRSELVSEEITLVPGRRDVLLGNLIADEEVDPRRLRPRCVVERLIHVVERRVIFRYRPRLL